MTLKPGLSNALFSPRSVALVGASSDPAKHTSLPQRYLAQHGYSGRVHPINPNRSSIGDLTCYASVSAVNQPIDHAFIMVQAPLVLAAVRDCVAAGVSVATILSSGFSEVGGEGQRLQDEILAEARQGGMRLVGPNCLGMVNLVDGVAITANEVFSMPTLPKGRLALVSQSGSIMGALVSRAAGRSIGFSKILSVGNEADLSVGEIGDMLVDDDDTDAILLFLETIRDATRMRSMALRAEQMGKPIIAFRLGRSRLGEKLAMSHTGALSSDGAAIDAFLSDIGIVRVDQIETLLEAPALVTRRRFSRGRRIAVMSTTGGGGGLVVDALAQRDLEVVGPDAALIRSVADRGVTISNSPLIDLTLAGARADRYGAVLEALFDSPHCDAIVAVVGSSAEFRPDRAVQPIVDLAHRVDKPLAVFITAQADESHRLLRAAGIATFRTPESCADALDATLRRRPPRQIAGPVDGVDVAPLVGLGAGQAPLEASLEMAAILGAPAPASATLAVKDTYSAREMPVTISYPAVAKIVSSAIPHKTEAGGVFVGAKNTMELARACEVMVQRVRETRPDAALEGIRIESQEKGLAEAIVGYRVDPAVGPVVTVGAGGVLAEIHRDVTMRPAPVTRSVALEMIGDVRAFAAIRGYRSLPLGDLEALAGVVEAMSRLACVTDVHVQEAEINPVLVKPEGGGVVSLDALFVIGDRT